MKEIKLCFVRHGITEDNLIGVFAGRTDKVLCPEGEDKMREMVRKHPYPTVDTVYSSPARRCVQTAKIAFPETDNIVILPDLWELDFGEIDGMYSGDVPKIPNINIDALRTQKLDTSFPGGETFGHCLERGRSAIDYIVWQMDENGWPVAGVSTHSMLLSLISRHYMCDVPEENRYFPNGMGVMVAVYPGVWREKRQMRFMSYLPENAERPEPHDNPYQGFAKK
jgi:alpha-ribazole phosphatase